MTEPPAVRREVRRLKAEIDREFRHLIEQGIAEGSLRKVDPKLAAFTLAFGGVHAQNGVGFDVAPGSITSVIGSNGAGKTSLFNTISGFYRPTAGHIRFSARTSRSVRRRSGPSWRWRAASRTSRCSAA